MLCHIKRQVHNIIHNKQDIISTLMTTSHQSTYLQPWLAWGVSYESKHPTQRAIVFKIWLLVESPTWAETCNQHLCLMRVHMQAASVSSSDVLFYHAMTTWVCVKIAGAPQQSLSFGFPFKPTPPERVLKRKKNKKHVCGTSCNGQRGGL